MRRLLAAACPLVLALSSGAGEASADIVFSLQSVTFDDGGIATGEFITDDAVTSLLGYDITTSGGILPGFRYNSTTAPVDLSSMPSTLVVEEDATPVHLFQLTFLGGLTSGGAPILLGADDSFEQVGRGKRALTDGSLLVEPQAPPPVPEPSALALAGVGVPGLLGYVRRRKRA
jgi:hypothetical protein